MSFPRGARPALLALLALTVGTLFLAVPFGPGAQYRVDLDVYRLGAQAWLDGTPLYGPGFPVTRIGVALPFIYPPIASVLFTPLLAVPFPVASLALTVASGAAAIGVAAVTVRALGHRLQGWWVAASVPLILLLDPVRLTLVLGQINILLLWPVTIDVVTGRGRPWRGVLVGLAAAVKLAPLVFVVWFLIDRDRRAARNAVLTFGAATALGLVLAPAESVRYWTDQLFRLDPLLAPEYAGNQSIRAVVARLGLLPGQATALWLLLAVGVLVLGAAVAYGCRRRDEPALGALVVCCCGLLASPISWSHHWVWCLPALPVLVDAASRWGVSWPLWFARTGLALFAVGPHWLLPAQEHRELAWAGWQQVVGASYVLWGLALVVAAAVRPTGTGTRSRPASPPTPRSVAGRPDSSRSCNEPASAVDLG